ncbi:enoyl-CoA hydratase-related protein [Vibrio profundum]|uniref:enoyl-CoA hydratase-related protein n=1 Tax=Vibrio profundum TaxID=2910247 RepID=UPI003D0AF022
MSETILCNLDGRGVATLTLNRPTKRNAFNDEMIAQLISHLHDLKANPEVRCLILCANGEHFSAGADLHWMKAMADKSKQENQQDAEQLAQLMKLIDRFPHPTIAAVQGCAYGGALGLISCADIVIAQPDVQFCFSEVKLGLVPATIGPYVCRAIGARQARRYMLTAEAFSAQQAQKIGLVHKIAERTLVKKEGAVSLHGILHQHLTNTIEFILANSPEACTRVKELCRQCDESPIDDDLIAYTSRLIADARVSPQGQEGLRAFFDQRTPTWSAAPNAGDE